MKNFNRGGQKHDFSGNQGSRPGMHQAICSECGKECEVPFRPTGDRPVFCNTCFGKHSNTGSARPERNNFRKPNFDNKRMFEAVCDKCGNKCEVPFKPTSGKPVYCSQCFDKNASPLVKSPDQFKQQFEILNSKLDKILKVLNPTTDALIPKSVKSEKETKKVKAKKEPVKPASKKAKAKKK
ncbi:MAG: CxxC-x17-CxxC domain-containing protein [Patescibacteria group bacterium]